MADRRFGPTASVKVISSPSIMTRSLASTHRGHEPLLTFRARPSQNHPHGCPFGNESIQFTLHSGGCLYLRGPSGLGKTSLAMHISGLLGDIRDRGILVEQCDWDPSLPVSQRCGVLFQQTTLLDELTVAGNLCVALQAAVTRTQDRTSTTNRDHNMNSKIKQLLEAVGLDFARDAHKRPSQLSGGMARRASLALQLAQQKHVIVLDEPFTGLDPEAALSVAKELVHLRNTQNVALLLISHEPDLAAAVMDSDRTKGNVILTLEPPKQRSQEQDDLSVSHSASLFGTCFRDRCWERLVDYLVYSLPLILLAFAACGLAIAMLTADLMQRIELSERILAIVNEQVKPLIQLVTGAEPNALTMLGINMKVKSMINSTIPEAKAKLYALGMAKLFVLEIGPLLTALLLAGRIGGSYAGKVATMQATSQNNLLRTLGISPVSWTLWPSFLAALVAAPILTAFGTFLALVFGGVVGTHHGVVANRAGYWSHVHDALLPELRLRLPSAFGQSAGWIPAALHTVRSVTGLRTSFSNSLVDLAVEVLTYPVVFHIVKADTFILIILLVSEVCARRQSDLTPRGVPLVITTSVVIGSLLVILADWGFSQVYLMRK